MPSDLSDRPERNQDSLELLSERARRRINTIHEAGLKAREEASVLCNRAGNDPESELRVRAANFDAAFRTMAALMDELQGVGIFGERLRAIMAHEIEAVTNGMEIKDGRQSLEELLFTEWGW